MARRKGSSISELSKDGSRLGLIVGSLIGMALLTLAVNAFVSHPTDATKHPTEEIHKATSDIKELKQQFVDHLKQEKDEDLERRREVVDAVQIKQLKVLKQILKFFEKKEKGK